jgi:hypothetical protein
MVYEHLRNYVRLTGEAQEDPVTGKISSITITDIEPVAVEGIEFESFSAEAFWREESLEQLAADQAVQPLQRLEDVLGRGAELWADNEDFETFLAATGGIKVEEV